MPNNQFRTTVRRVLALRLAYSQAATKKFDAIRQRQYGGRVMDTLQFCGASRTGRWAGRGIQLQNLKRTPKDADEIADLLCENPWWFEQIRSLEDLGSIVRSAFTAPDGKRLVVADLSSIESRVLGCLTGCRWINRTFEQGLDTYSAFAQIWLKILYDEVDKATRDLCKPPFLGFGFGIGAAGLKKYADSMGVEMTEDQCQSAIETARKVCHEVPDFWRRIEAAFRFVVQSGNPVRVRPQGVLLAIEGRFLTITLPSGRKLYYDSPEYDPETGECAFMGQNQYTGKWERIVTWGGKLTENLCQAIARDVLAHGMLRYEEEGGTVIGHVHDEVIAEEDADRAEDWLRTLNACLSETPEWMPGLLLGSEGYVSRRYRKA